MAIQKLIAQLFVVLVLAASVGAGAWADEAAMLAFPGAEGFGAHARGGRGGRVIFVTNLHDCGPGSLRDAVNAEGPRYVLFRVSGIIELRSSLEITSPCLTVAGQTAPGDGICLKNFDCTIRTHDVVIRHMRFRPGDEPGPALRASHKVFEPDAISIGNPSHDVILDHCSASWSIDESCSTSGVDVDNVTVQWCIISESLNDSFHHKGPHGYGSLIRAGGDVTYHHNLYAHHKTRGPRPGTYGDGSILFDFRNNVIYDTNGYSAEDPVRMNYVGNYVRRPEKWVFKVGGSATHMFQTGNYLEGAGERNTDFWQLIDDAEPQNRQAVAYDVAAVSTNSAEQALAAVLESAGATLPRRDPVDARVVEQVRQGTGKIIDSQTEVGGWPEYHSAAPPRDSDCDGMPDAWEVSHDLQPMVDDHNGDADGDGYTNLEEFLNRADRQAIR